MSIHGRVSMNRFDNLKQRTYHDLLNAGLELIVEKGYDPVTVADIARQADYGRSTFYLHFRDKEDLVWALLKSNMAAVDAQIESVIHDLESPEREWQAWRIIFVEIDRARLFFSKLNGDLSRRLRQWHREYLVASFEQQLRDGYYSLLMDVPPDIGSRFVVATLLELAEYWLQHPEIGDSETMAKYMYQLIFRRDLPQP